MKVRMLQESNNAMSTQARRFITTASLIDSPFLYIRNLTKPAEINMHTNPKEKKNSLNLPVHRTKKKEKKNALKS